MVWPLVAQGARVAATTALPWVAKHGKDFLGKGLEFAKNNKTATAMAGVTGLSMIKEPLSGAFGWVKDHLPGGGGEKDNPQKAGDLKIAGMSQEEYAKLDPMGKLTAQMKEIDKENKDAKIFTAGPPFINPMAAVTIAVNTFRMGSLKRESDKLILDGLGKDDPKVKESQSIDNDFAQAMGKTGDERKEAMYAASGRALGYMQSNLTVEQQKALGDSFEHGYYGQKLEIPEGTDKKLADAMRGAHKAGGKLIDEFGDDLEKHNKDLLKQGKTPDLDINKAFNLIDQGKISVEHNGQKLSPEELKLIVGVERGIDGADDAKRELVNMFDGPKKSRQFPQMNDIQMADEKKPEVRDEKKPAEKTEIPNPDREGPEMG